MIEKIGINQPNELVEIQSRDSEVQFCGGKKPIENSNPVTTNKPNPVPKKYFAPLLQAYSSYRLNIPHRVTYEFCKVTTVY